MSNKLIQAALWLKERPNGVEDVTVATPTAMCKAAGFKDLKELGKELGKPVSTLINWHRDQPKVFACVLVGAAVLRD